MGGTDFLGTGDFNEFMHRQKDAEENEEISRKPKIDKSRSSFPDLDLEAKDEEDSAEDEAEI